MEWELSPLPGDEAAAAAARKEPWFVSDKENMDPRAAIRRRRGGHGLGGGGPPNGGAGWATPSDKDAVQARLGGEGATGDAMDIAADITPQSVLLRAPGAAPGTGATPVPSTGGRSTGGRSAGGVRTPMMDITPEFVRAEDAVDSAAQQEKENERQAKARDAAARYYTATGYGLRHQHQKEQQEQRAGSAGRAPLRSMR